MNTYRYNVKYIPQIPELSRALVRLLASQPVRTNVFARYHRDILADHTAFVLILRRYDDDEGQCISQYAVHVIQDEDEHGMERAVTIGLLNEAEVAVFKRDLSNERFAPYLLASPHITPGLRDYINRCHLPIEWHDAVREEHPSVMGRVWLWSRLDENDGLPRMPKSPFDGLTDEEIDARLPKDN